MPTSTSKSSTRVKRKRIEVEIEEPLLKDEVDSKYETHIDSIKALSPTDYLQEITRDWILTRSLESLLDEDPVKRDKLPKNFIPIYSKIREMRRVVSAAVDGQGCATLPYFLNFKLPLKPIVPKSENFRLQVLISLMLSSQTKDEMNFKSMCQLMVYCLEHLDPENGISFKSLMAIDEQILNDLIHSVGFHTRKAGYIKKAIAKIVDENANLTTGQLDIPYLYDDIIALPGVGPKMANLLIQAAWGYGEHGIGVDVHVDRLSRMFGWVASRGGAKTNKNPEETRVALQEMLPVSLWTEINPVLVGFGQSICVPRGSKCNECLINDICPGRIKAKISRTYTGYEDWFDSVKNILPIRTVEGDSEIKPSDGPLVKKEEEENTIIKSKYFTKN